MLTAFIAICTVMNWGLVWACFSIVPELKDLPEIAPARIWLSCLPFAVLAAWGTVLFIQQLFLH